MKYMFQVVWSEEEGQWVGFCPAFYRLSTFEPTEEAALASIIQLVEAVVEDMRLKGEEPPPSVVLRRALDGGWVIQ
jgi:predicted RNase H-like HicB family nuclease